MNELKEILQELSGKTGVLRELLPGMPAIELAGNHALMIETHSGIGEYKDDKITVRLRKGELTVEGRDLQLHRMDRSRIVIVGRISCLRMEGR